MTKNSCFNTCRSQYVFRFKTGFFLLCLFLFVLCCFLGAWQLKRYEFKKTLLTQYQQQLNAAPIALSAVETEKHPLQYLHVAANGMYLNNLTLYVQNQFDQEKLGYEVLTPLRIPGQHKLLLIDRGWVAEVEKNTLPDVVPVDGLQKITGHIKLLNEYQFILGDNILQPNNRPLVVQKIQINELEKITGQSFYPFLLRLDVNSPHGFVRDWVVTSVQPERHMGYAVQWFAFAAVLLIAFICFCFERVESSHEKES